VGYQRGRLTITPTRLEPRISFPDGDINSNFSVVQGMTAMGLTTQGLPSARPVVSDGALE
jgi:hypothetical protein